MATINVSLLTICLIFIVSRIACKDHIFSTNNGFHLNVNESHGSSKFESRMRVKIYVRSSIKNSSTLDLSIRDTEGIFKNIDHSKPFVIYIHGYFEHPEIESVRTVVEAYLERGTDNIMVLDWSRLAAGDYITVLSRLQEIARIMARTFDDLVQLGLQLKNSHVIGHSVGGHLAGFVGKHSRNLIPRITALDPSTLGFYQLGADHIDADSAKFVDIVHTDGGVYGPPENTGTVEFMPNGGLRLQPGCPLVIIPFGNSDFCSHRRSWRFYAESVLNEYAFPAVECTSYADFSSGKCASNRINYFGYSTSTDARGTYYFDTNAKSPFGKNSITKNRVKV